MKIELGCGKSKKEGFHGVDIHPFEGVDTVCDITKGLPFPDSSVDFVYSQDLLEHIMPERKVYVINEIWRVLKRGGQMEHFVPNAGSRNDFGSPSHLSHWSLQQFEHFDVDSYRYWVDHEYEGFLGGFKKVLAERVNVQPDEGYFEVQSEEGKTVNLNINMAQSIHVIYEAIK